MPNQRILRPEGIPLAGLTSLMTILSPLEMSVSRLQRIPDELRNDADFMREVSAHDGRADEILASLLWKLRTGCITTLVVAKAGDTRGYAISPMVWTTRVPGFLAGETLREGHLMIVPPLMPNGSLEASLSGAPLYGSASVIEKALLRGPLSEAKIRRILQSFYQQALRDGLVPTNEKALRHVRSHPDIGRTSASEILRLHREEKPPELARAGRRRGASVKCRQQE
jgi:hypothetical protein